MGEDEVNGNSSLTSTTFNPLLSMTSMLVTTAALAALKPNEDQKIDS